MKKGWLQNILKPPATTTGARRVPAQQARPTNLPAQGLRQTAASPPGLPNATVIYGIGASLMFVAAFFLLIKGRWFSGLATFALGVGLMGFALHLLKHQD